jgi:hypothetical protein
LRHRLRIEAAVVDGAKNVIRTLQSTKTIDKKALQEVSAINSKLYSTQTDDDGRLLHIIFSFPNIRALITFQMSFACTRVSQEHEKM